MNQLGIRGGNINVSDEKNMVIAGTVMSGTGRAAFFTQLEWVNRQCVEKLGFEPYPGTLNLMVSASDRKRLMRVQAFPGVLLTPPDDAHCAGLVYPILIGKIPGAIIRPETRVRTHGEAIVEVLAPVCLRDAFTLNDGDSVSFTIFLEAE